MSKSKPYVKIVDKEVLPSAFSLFGPSWKAVKVNPLTIIEFALIPLMFNLLVLLIFRKPGDASFSDLYLLQPEQINLGTSYYAGIAINAIITLLLFPAGTLVYLKSVEGKTIDFISAIRQSLHFWLKFIAMSALTGLAVIGGLTLFVIPGILIYQRLLLAGYFMINKDLGIMESLKTSWNSTKRYSSSVWGVLGITVGISLLSSLLVKVIPMSSLIGQIALLVYSCAPAVRYIQIQKSIKKLA